MSDGHLTDIKTFNRIVDAKTNRPIQLNIGRFLNLIKVYDFPEMNNGNEYSENSISRYPGGIYVRRGACLIINQVFEQDSSRDRKRRN